MPVPLNGRVAGFALAIVALAVALRVAWAVIEPVIPALLGLAAIVVVYRVLLGGFKQ